MKLIKNLFLSLVTIVIVLAIAEFGLHLANFPASPQAGWKWDQSPYRGVMNQDDKQTNQLGLRGQKIEYSDKDFVVLLVGDSQTEAGTQTADQIPEIKLQQALRDELATQNVKVFSIASAGWGQDQQLVWLKKYFEQFRADAVVVWTTPVNDYWENTFIDRSVTTEAGKLKPTFAFDGEKLRTMMPAPREIKLRNLLALALGQKVNDKKPSIEQVYLNRWLRGLPSKQREATTAASCPTANVKEQEVIEAYRQGSRAYTLLTEEDVENSRSHFSPFLKNHSPRDDYSIGITHRLFEELATISQQNKASFNILHTYRNDLDAAFREIKCVKNTKTNTYFEYDGSDWLRYLKSSPLSTYLIALDIRSEQALNVSPGDWHFGEAGNTLAMQELAKVLVKNKKH